MHLIYKKYLINKKKTKTKSHRKKITFHNFIRNFTKTRK